jgi:type IV pilus assembly protein PilV
VLNTTVPARNAGFTLIEVLVALVVLSMGLLGVAALQLTSLRANTSAAQRSQATFLAYDIADRMRANRKAAQKGAYNVEYTENGTGSADKVARNDLKEWKERIAATFPRSADGKDATGRISSADNIRFTISIQWDDERGEADELIEFSTQTQI